MSRVDINLNIGSQLVKYMPQRSSNHTIVSTLWNKIKEVQEPDERQQTSVLCRNQGARIYRSTIR